VLVSEISTRVKRQFGDESAAQVTDADVIRWVNDAQKEIAIKSDLLQVKGTQVVTNGISEYSFPANLLTLRSVAYDGRILQSISLAEAQTYISTYDSGSAVNGTGAPMVYWIYAGKINLFPVPDNSTKQLVIYYTREPVEVAVVGDTPELSVQFHPRIVEYCIANAMELDDNFPGAAAKMGDFERRVAETTSNVNWQSRKTYPMITASPDDYMGDFPW
jgi:hypothetical protein